jgi:hypothetical protein
LMTAVRDQAYEYMKTSCEASLAYSEMGEALQSVGEAEQTCDPALASMYSNTGVFVNDIAIEVGKQAHASIISFEEPLLEQLNLLQSVKRALLQREAARVSYLNAKLDTIGAEAAHLKVVGVEGKRDQVQGRKFAYEGASKAERDAKARLDFISNELLLDYQRFRMQKAVDLKSIMIKFANLQVTLSLMHSAHRVLISVYICSYCYVTRRRD